MQIPLTETIPRKTKHFEDYVGQVPMAWPSWPLEDTESSRSRSFNMNTAVCSAQSYTFQVIKSTLPHGHGHASAFGSLARALQRRNRWRKVVTVSHRKITTFS